MKFEDYDHDESYNEVLIKEIEKRWQDFSQHDINQFKELPPWNVIVKDIKDLIVLCKERYKEGWYEAWQVNDAIRDRDNSIP